jgi:hypothetical protein
VKVEHDEEWRTFSNVIEMRFWNEHEHYKKVADWLAPCEYLSPDGRVLLQRRASVIVDPLLLPSHLPAFLTDLKKENFGIMDGRLVCLDYEMTIPNPSTRLKKVEW